MLNCPGCNNDSGKWVDLKPKWDHDMVGEAGELVEFKRKFCPKCGFVVEQLAKRYLAEFNPGVGSGG